MKKILLTSLSALMLSVVAAGAAENSSNTKIFFGVNAGMYTINYDSIMSTLFESGEIGSMIFEDTMTIGYWHKEGAPIKFPKNDTVIGMEAGMRFGGYKSIWNGGFTLSADKTLGKRPDIQLPKGVRFNKTGQMLVGDLKVSTNILAATFDNYIRLNKSLENRVDLVVGIGAASIETNIKLFGMGLSMDCHAAVLKAGLELQLTDVISMTLGTRMYMPVASQYFDTSYAIKGGFKFSF